MLKARMEKINLTRWNFTDMRSPLLRSRKAKKKNFPESGWGRDGLTTSHRQKKTQGFPLAES